MAQGRAGECALKIGTGKFPCPSARVRNLRKGPTFWTHLEEQGIPCTVLRVPAGFSDRGKPFLIREWGRRMFWGICTFAYFTDDDHRDARRQGSIYRGARSLGQCVLPGPENSLPLPEISRTQKRRRKRGERRCGEAADWTATYPFQVFLDPDDHSRRSSFKTRRSLAEGEWSEWMAVRLKCCSCRRRGGHLPVLLETGAR